MKKYCSNKLTQECQRWHDLGITLLVIMSTITLAIGYNGFHLHEWKEAIIVGAAVIAGAWSLWVVRTLRGMLHWWQDMHGMVDSATQILQEAKSDIKEIKSLTKSSQ